MKESSSLSSRSSRSVPYSPSAANSPPEPGCTSPSEPISDSEDSPSIHDIIIIGSGPCGLALAARLKEPMPSAIFTDEEHSRYHWIKKHTGKLSIKNWRDGKTKQAKPHPRTKEPSMLVLDKDGGQWMSKWNRLFHLLEIEHLRSPMFFHVDPAERDALITFAQAKGRHDELKEIVNCVGKERSKHSKKKMRKQPIKFQEPAVDERDRRDYFTPSSKLFAEHCEGVINRYGLQKSDIRKETLLDVNYAYVDAVLSSEKLFTLTTNKTVHYSRTVVLAVGAGNGPDVPRESLIANLKPGEGQCHAMAMVEFPDPLLRAKIQQGKETSILVIGGGLTAAQIADNALRHGVSKVYLLMRSEMKVKPFDVGLDWVGKFKNLEHSTFWSAESDEERLAMIQQARNGGSITPTYHKRLEAHIASRNLHLHTHTTVASQTWNSHTKTWTITTFPQVDKMPQFDYLYHSTGIQTSVSTLPYLRTIQERLPTEMCGGLPCLTEDLMWRDDIPLFFTGKCAGLRLGPGAGNLAGARMGAERVAWKVEELLGSERLRFTGDIGGNRYEYLCEQGENAVEEQTR